jgi:hypothetical protein
MPAMKIICPEYLKTIRLDSEWRAEVIVQQKLVFLKPPAPGCLRDVCAVTPGTSVDELAWKSFDAREISRRLRGDDCIVIEWEPKEPVVPFALYEHEYICSPRGAYSSSALHADVRCEVKTGLLQFEIVTPNEFEAAVVFERPGMRRISSERKLIKYALRQLHASGERPAIVDGGRRVQWKVLGPRVGVSFVLVAFRRNGVAIWEDDLRKTSMFGRARALFGRLAST